MTGLFRTPHRSAALLLAVLSMSAHAETIRWNIKSRFGVTSAGIADAITAAKKHFTQSPNDTVLLEFDEGIYRLKGEDSAIGTIDLSRVKPGPDGRLVFQGAGMDKTVLVFGDNIHAIAGRDVSRVTMADMHMTRERYTVSQGEVVEVAPGKVVLEIHEGFPTPAAIFDAESDQGRYLRRYTNSKTEPQMVVENNPQIAWSDATHLEGRRWQINLRKKSELANYSKGDLIGIKSKHGGQAYWFMGGTDFVFSSVKWTHKTRGVFRGGFDKIQILRCVTERAALIAGQSPCLAAPGGGPQIGQPWDPPIAGNLVKDCRFFASGDDAVAFFHAKGEIRGCHISDAFARGILAADSPDAVIEGNTLLRCPIQRSKGHALPKEASKQPE